MITYTKLEQEYLDLKEKIDKLNEEKKPLQKRFTYVRNRISTLKVRESKRKLK